MNKIILLVSLLIAANANAHKICGIEIDPNEIIHMEDREYGLKARQQLEVGADYVLLCNPSKGVVYVIAAWHDISNPSNKSFSALSFKP